MPFELRTKRDITTFGGQYQRSAGTLDLNFAFTSTGRKGNQPLGRRAWAWRLERTRCRRRSRQRNNEIAANVEWSNWHGDVQGRLRRLDLQQRRRSP